MRALFLVVALSAQAASAPSAIGPAELGRALIDALTEAAIARDRLTELKLTGEPYSDTFSTMVAKRGAIARLLEAQTRLRPFSASTRELIRETGEFSDAVFGALVSGFTRSVALDEKMLAVRSEAELPALVTEASKIAAQLDEAWRGIPLITAGVTHALIDRERTTPAGALGYLLISETERKELFELLLDRFGEAAAKAKGGQHAIEVSAGLFGGWLQQGWRTSDSK